MSWLQKLLPPKIQRTGPGARKTVPEGLWTKCAACDAVLYSTDLEKNLNVCPKCGHHERLGARPRLDALLDPDGRFEIGSEVLPLDPLKFKDSRRYSERLAEAQEETAEGDALVVNVSTDAALNAYPHWGAYGGSKAALHHLSRIWDEELTPEGIRVVSIDPGDMDTPMHALAVPDADRSTLKRPDVAAREVADLIAAVQSVPAGHVAADQQVLQ